MVNKAIINYISHAEAVKKSIRANQMEIQRNKSILILNVNDIWLLHSVGQIIKEGLLIKLAKKG